jgi:hypothetical protein
MHAQAGQFSDAGAFWSNVREWNGKRSDVQKEEGGFELKLSAVAQADCATDGSTKYQQLGRTGRQLAFALADTQQGLDFVGNRFLSKNSSFFFFHTRPPPHG